MNVSSLPARLGGSTLLYLLIAGQFSAASCVPVGPEVFGIRTQELTDKSKADARSYQLAELPNGLQVLNIQDARSRKAAVAIAIAVKAGAFDDPEDIPGLAHFCEHMLFLGSKKYAGATSFDDFLASAGGESNTYTAPEVTVYHADFSAASSSDALARFADMFRAPLFNKQYTEKEVHAIDSEHSKNTQDPMWRTLEVFHSLADPRSPEHHFTTGNYETLYTNPTEHGKDPVDALKVYFQERYCPQQFRLVTVGPDPVSQQLSEVAQQFGDLKPRSEACASSDVRDFSLPAAYPQERLSKFVVVEGSETQAKLWLYFPLPDLTKDFQSQPMVYIDYLLTYGGENSFKNLLIDDLGLISRMVASSDSNSAGTKFFIIFTLSKQGSQHLNILLECFFWYLGHVRGAGVDQGLYQSMADLLQLQYDWLQPSAPMETAKDFAERMTRLPSANLLSGDALIDRLDPDLVASLLAKLVPENMIAAYLPPSGSSGLLQNPEAQVLPYYGLRYTVSPLATAMVLPDGSVFQLPAAGSLGSSDGSSSSSAGTWTELRARLQAAGLGSSLSSSPPATPKQMQVPKNISTSFMRASVSTVSTWQGLDATMYGPRPWLLATSTAETNHEQKGGVPRRLNAKSVKVWYRSGWMTISPLVSLSVALQPYRAAGEGAMSVLDKARLLLYSKLLSKELTPKLADLTATGASFKVVASSDGLSFSFNSFESILPQLIEEVLAVFNKFNLDRSLAKASRFNHSVEELRDELSAHSDMPFKYAVHDRALLLTQGAHSFEEVLAVLDQVSVESMATSLAELVLSRPLELSALAIGNMDQHKAREAANNISAGILLPEWVVTMELKPNTFVERVTPVTRPSKPVEVRARNPRKGDPNDVALVTIIDDVATIESRATYGILGKMLKAQVYNELRTQQQLGYVVSAGAVVLENVHYVAAIVQGTVLGADDLEAAIEAEFLGSFPKYLEALTEQEFQLHRSAFLAELLQPASAAKDEMAHFWPAVAAGGHCFELLDELIHFANSSQLSQELLQSTWRRLMSPASGLRRKVTVKYFAHKVPARPSAANLTAALAKRSVPPAYLKMLAMEREQTLVFDNADSAARNKIVEHSAEGNGYFPSDVICQVREQTPSGQAPSDGMRPTFLQRRRAAKAESDK